MTMSTDFLRGGKYVMPTLATFGVVTLATLIRMALSPLWGSSYTFMPYFPAITFCAAWAGWPQGLLATLLSASLSFSLFFGERSPIDQAVTLAIFFLVSFSIIAIIEAVNRRRSAAEQTAILSQARERVIRGELEYQKTTEMDLRDSWRAALNLMDDAVEARTKAEQSMEALRESEARLRLALEAAEAGLWDRNLQTDEVYFSPEWKQQLGLSDEEFSHLWRNWEDRLHPDDRQAVITATQDFLDHSGSRYDLEYRLRHRDGRYRWIRSRGSLLQDKTGRPVRMLGLNLDISEHKKGERLRRRRARMEESFRINVATQTVAAIAHELNQPLAAVTSYAEAAQILLQAEPPNFDKLSEVLDKTAYQAERAGLVTRQLLSVLQKGELPAGELSLTDAVHEAIDLINAEGSFEGIEIITELEPKLPPVRATRLQIEKVLVNLIRNGVEAMQGDGISPKIIRISTRISEEHASWAKVTVSDCGKGAEKITFKNLFQPFYTTKANGLGMGLAISRSVIEAHGGKLWAEPNPDHGLSFHCTLPFAHEA